LDAKKIKKNAKAQRREEYAKKSKYNLLPTPSRFKKAMDTGGAEIGLSLK